MSVVLSTNLLDARIGLSPYSASSDVVKDKLRSGGMAVLALILVITGSFVRVRAVDEIDTADWLVFAQLALAIAGGCLGTLLIRRYSLAGFGAKLFIGYLLAVLVSAFFSSYTNSVVGYWILLSGTGVLVVGLVSSCLTQPSLRGIENLILNTIKFMQLKDTIIDVLIFVPMASERELEMYRLGMGSTSPNAMGLTAAVAFCMTFGSPSETARGKFWRFLWRGFFVFVVLFSRSRTALIALAVAIMVQWWFAYRRSRSIRLYDVLVAVPSLVGASALAAVMGFLLGVPIVVNTLDLVNRGEDSATIMSVTGRTDIWPYAVKRIVEGPVSFVFGHGYGASKLVLNENNWTASFIAYHAHNTYLEVLLSTGLLGAIFFVAIVGYSLKWLTRSPELSQSSSIGFRLRALTVVSAILSSTITESDLAVKVGPLVIIYLFYVLSLDRRWTF